MNERKLKEKGKTLLIITHDVNAIPELAERVIVLNKTVIADGPTRDIFSDTKMLVKTGLDVPVIMQLFEIFRCFGYPCDVLPLSIEGAVSNLTETIKGGDGHIHLHIHEHTHSGISSARSKYHNHAEKHE